MTKNLFVLTSNPTLKYSPDMSCICFATAKIDQQDYLIGCSGEDAENLFSAREYSIITLDDITSNVCNSHLLAAMKQEYDTIKDEVIDCGDVVIPMYRDIKFLISTGVRDYYSE